MRTEVLDVVNIAIADLEGSLQYQSDIDTAFSGWCNIVREEMYGRLPYRSVGCSVNNKRRRIGKPWWSDTLTSLWNKVCESERLWLKCNDRYLKVSLKSTYCNNRKIFDKEVQKSKRSYWYKVQSDILDDVHNNQNEFWK